MSKKLFKKQLPKMSSVYETVPYQPSALAQKENVSPFTISKTLSSPNLNSTSSLTSIQTPIVQKTVISPDSGFCTPNRELWHCTTSSSTPKLAEAKLHPRILRNDFNAVVAQTRLTNILLTNNQLTNSINQGQIFIQKEYSGECEHSMRSQSHDQQVPDESVGMERPMYSYMDLIKQAILSSRDGEMTLQEIVSWIETYFPYFKYKAKESWKCSIRHNLSIHADFIKIERKRRGAKWKIAEHAKKYHMKLPKVAAVNKIVESPVVTKTHRKGLQPILPKTVPFALVPISSIGVHSSTQQLVLPIQSPLPVSTNVFPKIIHQTGGQSCHQQTPKVSTLNLPARGTQNSHLSLQHKSNLQTIKQFATNVESDGSKLLPDGGGSNSVNIHILDGDTKKEKKIVFYLNNCKVPTEESSKPSVHYTVRPELYKIGQHSTVGQQREPLSEGTGCKTQNTIKRKCCLESICFCNMENEPLQKKNKIRKLIQKTHQPLRSVENTCDNICCPLTPPSIKREKQCTENSCKQLDSFKPINSNVSNKEENVRKNLRSRRKQVHVELKPEISPPKLILSSAHYNEDEPVQPESPDLLLNMFLDQTNSSQTLGDLSPLHCSISPPAGGGYNSSTPKHSPQEKPMSALMAITPEQGVSFNSTPSHSPLNQIANLLDTSLPETISLDLSLLDSIESYLNGDVNDSFKLSRSQLTLDY